MFLNINEIREERRVIDAALELPETRNEEGSPLLVGPARIVGEARPGPRGLELEGRIEARVSLVCSRCLEAVESAVATTFSLIVVPDAVEFGADETEVTADDAALFYAEGGRVDLRAIVTEQIYLNLPLKPLCEDACAGLCPSCGANRNRIECSCRKQVVDPRLAPLLDLSRRGRRSEEH